MCIGRLVPLCLTKVESGNFRVEPRTLLACNSRLLSGKLIYALCGINGRFVQGAGR